MILDKLSYENTEVVVSYCLVWELFFSMHVLSNPEHHVSRKKWVEYKEQCYPELINEIKELSELTDSWVFIIDSEKWNEIRQMEIAEMISFFRKKSIYQWQEWVKHPMEIQMAKKEKDRILNVVERYYDLVYRKEERVLCRYQDRRHASIDGKRWELLNFARRMDQDGIIYIPVAGFRNECLEGCI